MNSKKKSNSTKKIKRNLYKYHRTLGIITLIPVIFWCLSGLMHPIMSHWFRPSIAHEKLESKSIDTKQIKLSLYDVLILNNIDVLKNFNLVSFNNTTYYQIKTEKKHEVLYFDAKDGKSLNNGDKLYAEWLSRYFLDDQKSTIRTSKLLTDFDGQYKYINRYLPVWKVTFNRQDAMDVYIETTTSKLATYNPTSRKIQLWVFDNFHNWSFIETISNSTIRIVLMLFLLGIIITSTISGIIIYGFFWKNFKKTTVTDTKSKFKKHHRKIGLSVSIVTLTFAFSGGFHLTKKWSPYTLDKIEYSPVFKTADLKSFNLKPYLDSSYCKVGLIHFKNETYLQFASLQNEEKKIKNKYFAINSGNEKNIELDYAKFLANKFYTMHSNRELKSPDCCDLETPKYFLKNYKITDIEYLYDFDKREYGFVNKRLPVIKISYNTEDKTTIYIEPATSKLAAIITNEDRTEGYSFAVFHKYLFMDWAGKNVRDFVMAFAALGVLVVSLLGFYLFIARK